MEIKATSSSRNIQQNMNLSTHVQIV